MDRRDFIGTATGVLAAGALARCTSPVVTSRARHPPFATADESMDVAAFHAARRTTETRFGKIAYVERGAGEGALFLHGFPLNGFQWRGAIDCLSIYRRCVVPDFLGLGYTVVAEGQSVAADAQVAMLVELMDTLELSSADVVANDSGGAVAQWLAVRHPRRVRSLLLTNCDAEPDCPPAALLPVIDLARQGRFVPELLAPWLADKALTRSPNGLGGRTYTHPERLDDETIETYLAPLVQKPEWTHAYALALAPNVLSGIEPALGRCQIPVRIVWGSGDTIFSPDSADYLDRSFGNSRGVRRVPGAKLFFPEEFPDLIADEASRLWRIA